MWMGKPIIGMHHLHLSTAYMLRLLAVTFIKSYAGNVLQLWLNFDRLKAYSFPSEFLVNSNRVKRGDRNGFKRT